MTAMMNQYLTIKEKHADCLLLFRLGDFYELFFDDAVTASRELDIALTGRDCGETERAPMCGVPHHAAGQYIAQLVEKGYRVAVCEQMEAPKPGSKTPVKREVVRIITPGTLTEASMLDSGKNNYILCLHYIKKGCALAAADISTGTFLATYFSLEGVQDSDKNSRIIDEMARFSPSEVLVSEGFPYSAVLEETFSLKPISMPPWAFGEDYAFKSLTSHFGTMHLEAFGLVAGSHEISAAGALLSYLQETQKGALAQITSIKPYEEGRFLVMDKNTRHNLELTAPLRPWRKQNKKHTLLGVLDSTCTAMGARLLRSWIELPLLDVSVINKRLDAVEEWAHQAFLRAELRDSLKEMHDMERLMARLVGTNASGRDMAALAASLEQLPYIKEKLWETKVPLNVSMHRNFDDMKDLYALLDEAIAENPPAGLKEGGLIKVGYEQELDKLLDIKVNGEKWLSELEARERAATGIKSLKVRYNRVFGYYIEITKANANAAPENYIRKQTLANSERYTTPELDKLAGDILNAEEKRIELEYELFEGLRQEVIKNMTRIQYMASMVATVDAIQSLGDVADRNRYCKPEVNNGDTIEIKAGRHPVLEQSAPFVPNDTHIDGSDRRLALITGPNMAGKSTYMRQVALIALMAQIGSFVPADEAVIGAADRIFTRIGASDDLAGGQSTFMVEMTEVAHILHHATEKSLIILDEIGRGTSTYDGLSIAWAVLEHIVEEVRARTLFATHYHELTGMEERLSGVLNYSFIMGTDESGEDDVTFLRKLVRGGADRSYGIQVAGLAGVPAVVLQRAKKVLGDLERDNAVFFDEKESDKKGNPQ